MTPLREGPRIQTRLSMKEYARFQRHMREKRLSIGQLARDAICFYLDRLDEDVFEARETQVEQRLSSIENKMLMLLESATIDVAVLLSLVYSRMNKTTRSDEIKKAHHTSASRFRKKIDELSLPNPKKDRSHITALPSDVDSLTSKEVVEK